MKSPFDLEKDMRIGVVEVGSRSIRLMVATFQFDGSFKAAKTGSHLHGIEIDHIDDKAVADLWSEVERLYSEVRKFRCDRVMVYGTALCRKLASTPGQKLPKYLHVLSPEEEAMASWAAGFMCARGDDGNKRYTTIDQGAGSTEIASAIWTGQTVDKVMFDSVEIGNRKVMDAFYASGHTYARAIHEMLEPFRSKIERHKSNGQSELYLVGSVATKIAWLKVRRSVSDFYKPYLVNDVRLNVKEIFEIHSNVLKIYRESPERARSLIDSRSGAEDEFARVMSGSVFLMMLAAKLEYGSVKVSGYGIRHGLAFLVRRGLI